MSISSRHVNPEGTRVFMGSILNEDLHTALGRLMTEHGIRAGSVQIIGGITDIEFRAFDFTAKVRRAPIIFSGALEIVSAHGHLSYLDGAPHVHLHATVTAPHSGVWGAGGHVQRAVAFAVEYIIQAFDGAELVRQFDESTGLWIWDLPEI